MDQSTVGAELTNPAAFTTTGTFATGGQRRAGFRQQQPEDTGRNPLSDTLEITGLSLRARNRFVADALNLKIGSGEIYALLGPDVAAKAALVRATTRARPPRQGTISINGQKAPGR